MYRTDQKEWSSYIDGDFRKDYEQKVSQIMKNDRGHYQRMSQRHEVKRLIDVKEFRHVHSFGGGMPKLESLLPCKSITVYDVNADIYEGSVPEFRSLYPIRNTPVVFKNAMVNAELLKSIPVTTEDLFTFVHFLEHIDASDVRAVLDAIPRGVTVLIYQPNVSRGNSPGWFHYSDQHITLVAGHKMLEFVRLWYDSVVTTYCEVDEDFLLVFEKPIK